MNEELIFSVEVGSHLDYCTYALKFLEKSKSFTSSIINKQDVTPSPHLTPLNLGVPYLNGNLLIQC
jgi:hypothetical protein